MRIYLIGSLRNSRVPVVANQLRRCGFEVFDEWYSAGPEADDYWMKHQKAKGLSYMEALNGPAARNVFLFDQENIEMSDVVVLLAPAGKSGHLELGWAGGRGKPTFILMEEEPERWDVMLQFVDGIARTPVALAEMIHEYFAAMTPVGNA